MVARGAWRSLEEAFPPSAAGTKPVLVVSNGEPKDSPGWSKFEVGV